MGDTVEARVQFKFGETWQLEYVVGDELTWGANDHGSPGLGRVQVDGWREKCSACGDDEERRNTVIIENDVITAVEPSSADQRVSFDRGFDEVIDEPGASDV